MAELADQLASATTAFSETLAEALKDLKVPLAARKLTKAQADYRPETEDDKSCVLCRYMNPKAATCDRVKGRIEPDWVCNLFHAKED